MLLHTIHAKLFFLIAFINYNILMVQVSNGADTSRLAGAAVGLAVISTELATDPQMVYDRTFVTVVESNTVVASDVAVREWVDPITRFTLNARAKRVTYRLEGVGFAQEPSHLLQHFLYWTTEYPGGKFSAKYYVDKKSLVVPMPFEKGLFLTYKGSCAPDSTAKEFKDTYLLPPGSQKQLSAAYAWRLENLKLFDQERARSDETVSGLKKSLSNENIFQRFASLAQLARIHQLANEDVRITMGTGNSTLETATAVYLVIHEAADQVRAVQDGLGNFEGNERQYEGVTLGAAAHFLTLDESFMYKALAFQRQRSSIPNLPAELEATVSYPLLLKIGDLLFSAKQPLQQRVREIKSKSGLVLELLKACNAIPIVSRDSPSQTDTSK